MAAHFIFHTTNFPGELQRGLRGGQSGDGHAEGGAASGFGKEAVLRCYLAQTNAFKGQ
jgi:hypothetical protein